MTFVLLLIFMIFLYQPKTSPFSFQAKVCSSPEAISQISCHILQKFRFIQKEENSKLLFIYWALYFSMRLCSGLQKLARSFTFFFNFGIIVGNLTLGSSDLIPSRFSLLYPQAYTSPAEEMAKECSVPHEIYFFI